MEMEIEMKRIRTESWDYLLFDTQRIILYSLYIDEVQVVELQFLVWAKY